MKIACFELVFVLSILGLVFPSTLKTSTKLSTKPHITAKPSTTSTKTPTIKPTTTTTTTTRTPTISIKPPTTTTKPLTITTTTTTTTTRTPTNSIKPPTTTTKPPTTTKRVATTKATTPRNACISRPCQNGGNCTSLPGGYYQCSCNPYYEGVNCEKNIFHPCRSRPCKTGQCIEIGNCTRLYNCVCPLGYTGKHCETKVPNYILNVTARENLDAVYLDGVEVVHLENANNWRKVASLKTPVKTRLIAVMASNIHDGCAGIILSENSSYVTSGSVDWKCNIDATHGWSDLVYDDSNWPPAHVVGDNGNVPGCPDMTRVEGIQEEAKWVWTTHNIQQDLVVYCRGYIDVCKSKPCQNGGTCNRRGPNLCTCIPGFHGDYCQYMHEIQFRITGREELNKVYVDGAQVNSGDEVQTLTIHPLVRHVAVMASDVHNPSMARQCFGILASSSSPVLIETIDVLSSSRWKCTATPSAGWYLMDYDDSSWSKPLLLQFNNQSRCQELKPVPGISEKAQWIWTPLSLPLPQPPPSPPSPPLPQPPPPPPPQSSSPQWDLISFCRVYTNICHANITICKNEGTCDPKKTNICTCRKNFTGTFCESEIGVDVPGPESTCPSDL